VKKSPYFFVRKEKSVGIMKKYHVVIFFFVKKEEKKIEKSGDSFRDIVRKKKKIYQ
jgi:hypothetical protein